MPSPSPRLLQTTPRSPKRDSYGVTALEHAEHQRGHCDLLSPFLKKSSPSSFLLLPPEDLRLYKNRPYPQCLNRGRQTGKREAGRAAAACREILTGRPALATAAGRKQREVSGRSPPRPTPARQREDGALLPHPPQRSPVRSGRHPPHPRPTLLPGAQQQPLNFQL